MPENLEKQSNTNEELDSLEKKPNQQENDLEKIKAEIEQIKSEVESLKDKEIAEINKLKSRLESVAKSLDLEEREYQDESMEINEIQKEIFNNIEQLEEEVQVIEVNARLDYKDLSEEEIEKNQKQIEKMEKDHPEQMKALSECAEVFNKNCKFPWYVIGSISFLIHAQESTKQPDDVDLIFNKNDFDRVKESFKNISGLENFESGEAPGTGDKFIKGSILVAGKYIEVEAFAQSTEEPKSLINPGAKTESGEEPREDERYEVIKNKLSQGEEFNIVGKKGQSELYLKNLLTELEQYKLGGKNPKASKFINRLTNLLELNESNEEGKKDTAELEILKSLKKERKKGNTKKSHEDFMELIEFTKEFKQENPSSGNEEGIVKSRENLSEIVKEKSPQELVETLKDQVEEQVKNINSIMEEINKKYNNNEEDFIEVCKKKKEIISNKYADFINAIIQVDKGSEVENATRDRNKKFAAFVFIKKFKSGFVDKSLDEIDILQRKYNNHK